jgi:hypothetical protein
VPLILKRFRQAVLAAATSGQLTEDWRAERKTTSVGDETKDEATEFAFVDTNCFGNYRFPASWNVARLGEIATPIQK